MAGDCIIIIVHEICIMDAAKIIKCSSKKKKNDFKLTLFKF